MAVDIGKRKRRSNELRRYREEKHLTQQDLADLVGVNRIFVSFWENDHSLPTHEQMEQIAVILEKPVAVIFVR